jgi:hypothetical protein
MVTLHRVGPDNAGPLDSVRADAKGRFRIDYRRFGSDEALYFAAAVYRGIAYFSAPLRGARVRGDDGAITVFDTTARSLPFTVRGHHLVISAPRPDGLREVVEVYELSNDTTVTVVPRDSLSPIWSAPIPHGAAEFRGGQGDVGRGALALRGDRVHLSAPFGPGVKQVSYSYVLKEGAFPLRFSPERGTSVLEVLLEEPGAQARGRSLRAMGDASTQGRTFKRFLGQDALAGEQLRIDVPIAAAAARGRVLVALAAAMATAMIAALARALRPRRRDGARPRDEERRAEALVAALAALDARHEARDGTLDASDYTARRAALKEQLAAALAAERTPA